MHITPQQLREDIEEQFEVPDMPPPMTANRGKDFSLCREYESEKCRRVRPDAFDMVNLEGGCLISPYGAGVNRPDQYRRFSTGGASIF